MKIVFVFVFLFIQIFQNYTANSVNKSVSGIPVFLSSDDNYAPYVATTMASILKNTKSYINFYVLSDNMSSKNKQKIKNTNKFFKNFSVRFIDINKDLNRLLDIKTTIHLTRVAYGRIFIPFLVKDAKKAIYLDDDMIIQGDIKDIYNTDLGDYAVGFVPFHYGIPDRILTGELIDKSGKFLSKEHKYFNSGLMLFNCDKWREKVDTNKIIDIAINVISKNRDIFSLNDQDTLNVYFNNNNYKELPFIYNNFSTNTKIGCKYDKQCDEEMKKSYIIHYAGDKPWEDKTLYYADKFWEIIKYTDFEDEINNDYKWFQNASKIKKILRNEMDRKIKNAIQNRTISFENDKEGENIVYLKNKMKQYVIINYILTFVLFLSMLFIVFYWNRKK